MSRNYEQHPECFPPVPPRDYDPDADGWKADAIAELKAAEPAEKWEPGDRVYDKRLGWPGTVIRVYGPLEPFGLAGKVAVDFDEGCSSVYAAAELEWYTQPAPGGGD